MIFETVVVGPLGVNCFILGCEETREGVVVDPGADADRILARVRALGLTIRTVINTHGHFDHIGGNKEILEATGARLMIHRDDVPFLSRATDVAANYGLATENSPPPDELLEDGKTVTFGKCALKVLHTRAIPWRVLPPPGRGGEGHHRRHPFCRVGGADRFPRFLP